MKEFKSHLCTFMGRQENLLVLMKYVERALAIDALDHYWMIDMTRCIEDHEFIYQEQQRLNEKFPGRVHIHNREIRGKELAEPEKIKEGIGSWKTFYEFLLGFNDNDVIAKCDDDTLYFDVETLRGAFEFRWKYKQPYLMHANCINNGITAYHQHQKGIWSTKETHVYPSCGLTGPLFSFPEIACEHHRVFTSDLMLNTDNIEKYKLNENISFTQRVSINFIFMLGADRDSLATIDLQDEYETSSKKPQQQDRCNCIIGDFTAAHHTYGVQEPVMEEQGTLKCYYRLVDHVMKDTHKNKPINDEYHITTPIKSSDNVYLAMHPATDNTCVLKHQRSGMYLAVESNKKEKIRFDKDRNKIGTGKYMLENITIGVTDRARASLLELDLTSGQSLLEFNNSNKLIRTGGSRKELQEGFRPVHKHFPGHMIAKFFHGGYKTELVNFISKDDGYVIQSNTHKDFYLTVAVNKKTNRMNFRYMRSDEPDVFIVEPCSEHKNKPVGISIVRCDDQIMNDGTYYKILDTNQTIYKPREYYWMVDHHIWQLRKQQDANTYTIQLVADNREPLYLGVKEDLCMSSDAQDWLIEDEAIKHIRSGKYLTISNNSALLSDTPQCFDFQLNK